MSEFGHGAMVVEGEQDVMKALADADAPRHGEQTPGQWVKANLFGSVVSSIFTVIFGLIGAYLAFRAGTFVFTTARWEPVRANLELFLIGLFPRSERTRLIVQALFTAGAAGMLLGWGRQRSIATAEQAGLERPSTSPREMFASYWGVLLFIAFVMAVGVRTLRPWLLLGAVLAAALIGFSATIRTRRGVLGVGLALVPLLPFAMTAGVLSSVQDLSNSGAYAIAAALTVLLAAVQFARTPAVTLSVALLIATAGFTTLSGTKGLTWLFVSLALAPVILHAIGQVADDLGTAAGLVGSLVFAAGGALLFLLGGLGLETLVIAAVAVFAVFAALRNDGSTGVRLGAFTVVGVVAWQVGRLIDLPGIDWDDWGGFHLNLITAAATTTLAFPIGLLLALGRRSSLPVLRAMCTAYIEIFRGVPLITLLFMAQLFIGFFLNGQNLPLVTKSVIVFTMFSSAYIAEIVRGGLQSVDKGQTEAGQAMGMSPAAITRLLVLPQALKAVIPAMVGQFISLFKDTSLLSFIGIPEFLGVREIVHSQAEFRGFGIAETLVFVAFGYWAFSFTMSRESQRLERRLDTGNR